MLFAFFSCKQHAQKQDEPKKESMVVQDTAKQQLKKLDFDSKKDLVCEMPVSAGVSDTTTYKGKLYGVCSQECKEELLKDPNQYLTAK